MAADTERKRPRNGRRAGTEQLTRDGGGALAGRRRAAEAVRAKHQPGRAHTGRRAVAGRLAAVLAGAAERRVVGAARTRDRAVLQGGAVVARQAAHSAQRAVTVAWVSHADAVAENGEAGVAALRSDLAGALGVVGDARAVLSTLRSAPRVGTQRQSHPGGAAVLRVVVARGEVHVDRELLRCRGLGGRPRAQRHGDLQVASAIRQPPRRTAAAAAGHAERTSNAPCQAGV